MPFATSPFSSPLRELRVRANLSAQEVVDRGRAISPDFPSSIEALYNIERRGTMKIGVIEGIARALQIPVDEVRTAAAVTRQNANKKCEKHLTQC